jgi:hypothetical protein
VLSGFILILTSILLGGCEDSPMNITVSNRGILEKTDKVTSLEEQWVVDEQLGTDSSPYATAILE